MNLNWKQVLLAGIIVSSGVELTQYITARGLAEIDDVISNTAGSGIGFGVCKMINAIRGKIKNDKA